MILQMKQPTSRSSVRWVRRCASSTCFRDSRWLGVRPRVCLRSQLVAFSIKLSPELFLRRKDKFVPAGEDLFRSHGERNSGRPTHLSVCRG